MTGGKARVVSAVPALWITGLGTRYPAYLLGPERLDEFAARFHDIEAPSLKKLLQINRSTGIKSRSAVCDYETGYGTQEELPTVSDMDRLYRKVGVDLTVQACKTALQEAGIEYSSITHTVGVTCTNQGSPGYDLLVNQKLGLEPTVDRTLLHGIGCAGGLAIMRTAAQLACGATMRGRPSRILAFACELCTPSIRFDLAAAAQCTDPANVSIASALFSDAAAAFVLCNEFAVNDGVKPIFQLLEWDSEVIPETLERMAIRTEAAGYRATLSRDVPTCTQNAIGPMFSRLLPSFCDKVDAEASSITDFDFALHPGGMAIIKGAMRTLGLTEDQLRASQEIYETRGNSSSPTVLAVLDKLRSMGTGRDYIVATAFGPGLTIEMSMLRRCRNVRGVCYGNNQG